MKANSLSISIPSEATCKKNCPYCISKMTGKSNVDYVNFFRNLKKARKIADNADISCVIITGKTEPLQPENLEMLLEICKMFQDYPIEVQTNGTTLNQGIVLRTLNEAKVNTIAVSIDSWSQLREQVEILKRFSILGFNTRVTINLTENILSHSFWDYIRICSYSGINQISFRRLTIPDNFVETEESRKAVEYIQSVNKESSKSFIDEFNSFVLKEGTFVRKLSFGASIYMFDDISVTVFENCIQENSNEDDIRSLIYFEDGHLSTSWYGSNHGRIF
jgi:molybdenum cofactor biosynthesis enzyme MoaA